MDEPAATSLSVWRLLLQPDAEPEAIQRALLSIPETTSFTFDADPTATSADLELLEEGTSLMLAAGSPAAKAMVRTVHVRVAEAATDSVCLGVFNAKEVKVRNDPVVRACALSVTGKGSCTNTSHKTHRLRFEGKRILIQTPVVSKATTPAYFSLPYLVSSELPQDLNMERLFKLSAPVGVWRSFFDGTRAVLPSIVSATSGKKTGLKIDTQSAAASPFRGGDNKSDDLLSKAIYSSVSALESRPTTHIPPTKEESPMSYDMVEDAAGEYKDDEPDDELPLSTGAPLTTVADYLDSDEQTQLLAQAAVELGVKLDPGDVFYDAQAKELATEVFGPSGPGKISPKRFSDDGSDEEENERFSEISSFKGSTSVRPCPPEDESVKSFSAIRQLAQSNAGVDLSQALLQQILSNQQNLSSRVRDLELENKTLRSRLSTTRSVAKQALSASASASINSTRSVTALRKEMAIMKDSITQDVLARRMSELTELKRELDAVVTWKMIVDDRMGSLELDLRSEDGLLLSLIRECKSAAAAGDASSYTVAGYTVQSEEAVLAMIQVLPGKNNYGGFLNMKTLFGLCGDAVTSLNENMLLHKATKSADFEDTYSARVNTASVVAFPAVFGRRSTTGDSNKLIWNTGFKSHAAFAGGMKNGGKSTTERQIRKAVELCRGQIRRKFPPHQYPMQNAIATGMLDEASLACFDFLDSISNFYHIMTSTGLSPAAAWITSLDMVLRVFDELEVAASESGEEDVDAGLIWSSMQIANKVSEFQRFRWNEHPCICAMLMFSVLERLGETQLHPEDSEAKEALEQCRKNHEEIVDLMERQKKDHEKAAEALYQVKQLRDQSKAKKETPK